MLDHSSVLQRIATNCRALLRDRSGNVALVFGLSLVPLMLAAGGAIDFSKAIERRSIVQQALDRSVVAAAVNGKQSAVHLQNLLNANLAPHQMSVTNTTLTTTTAADGGFVYTGETRFAVNTSLLKLIGLTNVGGVVRSEAKLPPQIVTATFTPTNTQGAYSKDIFLWTKNASGVVTSRQTVLTYRYSSATASSVTTPPIGTQTITFSVPLYTTYGLGMVAYQDSANLTGDLINPVESWTDAPNANTFIHKTGDCASPSGATYNWEDGGDNNYVDFVYTMRCTAGVAPGTVAHLSK